MRGHEGFRLSPAFPATPLAREELLACRGGGDHEDPWLWAVMGTWEPPGIFTGTGPTCPAPPPRPPL